MEQEIKQIDRGWLEGAAKTITFIVTKDCQLACKYCYLVGKNENERMSIETAKAAVDYILDTRDFFNEESVIWEFIGGEPFLEIDLIDNICDYIKTQMFVKNHHWFNSYRFNFATNGINYNSSKVQNFIKKNWTHLSIGITIDGTKIKHDLNRVYKNSEKGSYDDVVLNIPLWLNQFPTSGTKVTISSPDIPYIKESVLHLYSLGIHEVNINVVYEDVWKEGDDLKFEEQLLLLADEIIDNGKKLLMTKKKLPVRFTGQHFTIDKVLIKDAIRQANISNQDTVLDIGAGKGFLTVHLLKIANNVVAIENDTALVEHLRKLFSDARNVQVVGCDFRNFAVPKFPFKVVSNIPYGITSDIFKILMFESLGNFLGGSIVLQLEPAQKLFSRKLYNPYTVFYHTFFDLKLVYEVGPESFLPPPTVKSALLNIKRKHLFFDFKFKAKYLAFISCLLEKPDLSVKTALKSIFRKSQVRSISEKFGLNLNAQIVCLSPSQWLNCFLEMLEVVPEKFHPS